MVNKFLLVADIFMSEINLKQPTSVYSTCGPFSIIKERMQKFLQTGNTN